MDKVPTRSARQTTWKTTLSPCIPKQLSLIYVGFPPILQSGTAVVCQGGYEHAWPKAAEGLIPVLPGHHSARDGIGSRGSSFCLSQEPRQLGPDLLQPPTVGFPLFLQDGGDFRGGPHSCFRIMLNLEIHHLFDQIHDALGFHTS
jgi:hypothetical protein